MSSTKSRAFANGLAVCFLILIVLPFGIHAVREGITAMVIPNAAENRFYVSTHTSGNIAIFGHMIVGGLLSILAPLQIWGSLRRRLPRLHRWCGRVICLGGAFTGLSGLFYVFARGTIGEFWMDAGFALYGVLMVICAFQTLRYARARRMGDHQRWALRLFVLILGSWLYRVHYGVWYALTGGLASTPEFDGAFDFVQNFAFYVPYLLGLELWMRRSGRRINA